MSASALAVLVTSGLTGSPGPAAAGAAGADRAAPLARVSNACLRSVPERGSSKPVKICYTLFKPRSADRHHRVPLLMHSHGWAGQRTRDPEAFRSWLRAGYGVLSFDQRGFGESGGYAHVERPRFEGRDNLKLIRLVSRLRWVTQDGPGDPRLGALGGSYGGGYQFLGAFLELQRTGKPVYDALAPQITWHDLSGSLGPQGVPRVQWALLLGGAAQNSDALEPKIDEALVEGAATGEWPDGSGPSGVDMYRYFKKNGPAWHVSQGRRLGIPVLLGQGTTDTLFDLRQGLQNWHRALTPRARRRSIFVGYNGGHVLPTAQTAVPPANSPQGDPCSRELAGGDFTALTRAFFDEKLRGRDRGLTGYGQVHLATPGGTCTTVSSVEPTASYDVGQVATPSGASTWLAYPVAEGPISIAGSPTMTGSLTTVGVDLNRAFYGLAVGPNPAEARLVQGNVLPLGTTGVVTGEPWEQQLPAVAVDVPEGQTLYVMASAVSDVFGGPGARTPGAVVLDDAVVHLPVVE
ncbi:alpha/beta hydrolase family protein [Nocardioides aestuarii]|uniref:Alpha/beta hydrolase family protein n=1 Tax=Nocardioides aestuarii TaxID=252231 RepID=A0ABW4TQD3_9ACTN